MTAGAMVRFRQAYEELVSGRCSSVEHRDVVSHGRYDSVRRLCDPVMSLGTRIQAVSTPHRVSSTIHSPYYSF